MTQMLDLVKILKQLKTNRSTILLSLLCVRSNARPLTHSISYSQENFVLICNLQMRKPRLSEMWYLMQANTSIKCESQDTGSASRSDNQAYAPDKPAHSHNFHTFHCCSCTSYKSIVSKVNASINILGGKILFFFF